MKRVKILYYYPIGFPNLFINSFNGLRIWSGSIILPHRLYVSHTKATEERRRRGRGRGQGAVESQPPPNSENSDSDIDIQIAIIKRQDRSRSRTSTTAAIAIRIQTTQHHLHHHHQTGKTHFFLPLLFYFIFFSGMKLRLGWNGNGVRVQCTHIIINWYMYTQGREMKPNTNPPLFSRKIMG